MLSSSKFLRSSARRFLIILLDRNFRGKRYEVYRVYSASLVRGFWDEEFFAKKPRTTEVPRTREVHLFWACITPTCIPDTVYALKHVYVPARNFGSNLESAVMSNVLRYLCCV